MNLSKLNRQIDNTPFSGYLENFLEVSSASIYLKDKKGVYLGANQILIGDSGKKIEKDIIGGTDYDFPWKNQAEILIKNDQQVIKTDQAKTFIEPALDANNNLQYYFSHKAPLRTKNKKSCGVICLSFPINLDNSVLPSINKLISQNDLFDVNQIADGNLVLNKKINHILSQQQIKCLYYFTKGMTIKQIAKNLNLSPRTVEHYIQAVKLKLNCKSRYELITKALQLGIKV